jgi:hypothetical protein
MTQFVGDRPDALIFTSVKGSPLLYRYLAPFWNRAKEAAEIDPEVHFTTCGTWPATLRPVPGPQSGI